MLNFISEILLPFSSCFSRTAAFQWFVIIVVGFMVHSDSMGITSFIRDLALKPSLYPSLEHFFRSSSWEWDTIFYQWVKIVAAKAPVHRVSERILLIGDGIKRAADGRFMPCVQKMVHHFIYGISLKLVYPLSRRLNFLFMENKSRCITFPARIYGDRVFISLCSLSWFAMKISGSFLPAQI